jgi:hypothetical protein
VHRRDVHPAVRRRGRGVLHDRNRLPEWRVLRHQQQVLRGGVVVLGRGRNRLRDQPGNWDWSRVLSGLRLSQR